MVGNRTSNAFTRLKLIVEQASCSTFHSPILERLIRINATFVLGVMLPEQWLCIYILCTHLIHSCISKGVINNDEGINQCPNKTSVWIDSCQSQRARLAEWCLTPLCPSIRVPKQK